MNTFLTSAVIAAAISSIANLLIGLKALKETRKITKENRIINYLQKQKEELLKFLDELNNYKSLSSAELFLEAQTDPQKIAKIIDNSRLDYGALKKIYNKYSSFLDSIYDMKIKQKIDDYDKEIHNYAEYMADLIINDKLGKKNNKPEKKYNDAKMINLSSDFHNVLKDNLSKNIDIINEKFKKFIS